MASKRKKLCSGEGHEDLEFQEEAYEQLWTISDWHRVQKNKNTLKAKIFEFKTGKSSRAEAKWEMGFQIQSTSHDVNLYWKLVEASGYPNARVEASLEWTLLKKDFTDHITETQKKIFDVGEKMIVTPEYSFRAFPGYWGSNINSNGELVQKLRLTIMEPIVPSVELRMKEFHKASVMQLGVNFRSLLGDEVTADLKIRTKDGKELFAHKVILKAQCPVFESMFRSDLSENRTGIVNVKDVSSKPIGVLLHFFYSGELLPSWKDLDTVVEFTYAVGKYQLSNVLKLLDDMLGSRDEEKATYTDVQLLDLAIKLDLKTAEKELMERIKNTLCKVNKGSEFLALWGTGKE